MVDNNNKSDDMSFVSDLGESIESFGDLGFEDYADFIWYIEYGIKTLKNGEGSLSDLARKEIDVVFEDKDPKRPTLRYPKERPNWVEVVVPRNGDKTKTIGKRRQIYLNLYSGIIPNNEFTLGLRLGAAAKKMGIQKDSPEAFQQLNKINKKA